MTDFTRHATAAADTFRAALDRFSREVSGARPDAVRLPRKDLDRLGEIAARADRAVEALARSFRLIDVTALDLVDMQIRLEGESAALASALSALGDSVRRQHFIAEAFADPLVDVEESAMALAAATFPSAVEGLREVNVALWDFSRVEWARYQRTLAEVVQRQQLTASQQAAIQAAAERIRSGFEAVNELLNDLAATPTIDDRELQARTRAARRGLAAALAEARRRATDTFSRFKKVLGASQKVADRVDKLLSKLQVPLFPRHADLEELQEAIDERSYAALGGIDRFALLNIAARLRSIEVGGRHLLSPGFQVRVFRVFPDRIYFRSSPSLLDTVDTLRDAGRFEEAPAALHRFRDGSVKQRTFRKGNLQLSYAREGDHLNVDADIDLYRSPLRHLFGEVLVNHLTGRKTDQFAVREILDRTDARPIGGFRIVSV